MSCARENKTLIKEIQIKEQNQELEKVSENEIVANEIILIWIAKPKIAYVYYVLYFYCV